MCNLTNSTDWLLIYMYMYKETCQLTLPNTNMKFDHVGYTNHIDTRMYMIVINSSYQLGLNFWHSTKTLPTTHVFSFL